MVIRLILITVISCILRYILDVIRVKVCLYILYTFAYLSIITAQNNMESTACNNPHIIKNERVVYKYIKLLITGDLKSTVFSQIRNLLTHKDGVSFFKELTLFTNVASLQFSILSFAQLLIFDCLDHDYKIPVINTKISSLFFLVTT